MMYILKIIFIAFFNTMSSRNGKTDNDNLINGLNCSCPDNCNDVIYNHVCKAISKLSKTNIRFRRCPQDHLLIRMISSSRISLVAAMVLVEHMRSSKKRCMLLKIVKVLHMRTSAKKFIKYFQ